MSLSLEGEKVRRRGDGVAEEGDGVAEEGFIGLKNIKI